MSEKPFKIRTKDLSIEEVRRNMKTFPERKEAFIASIRGVPLGRFVKEGTIGDCPLCGSTTKKKFIWFGASRGCINSLCKNYYKGN